MRIALNLLSFQVGVLGGGETFMRELAIALSGALNDGDSLLIVSQGDCSEWLPLGAENISIPFWTTRPGERVLKEQLLFPWLLRREHVDVLIMPTNAIVRFARVPQVAVVHDLSANFYKSYFPAAMSVWRREYVLWSNRQAVRRAARIVVPSEFSRRELTNYLQARPDRIVVVPYAGSRDLEVSSPPAADISALTRYGLAPQCYLLAVSSKSKHKNLERLVSAWQYLNRDAQLGSLKLVLVGQPGYGYADIAESVARASNIVMINEHLNEAELDSIYQNSAALVFPSLYEGWGLPVLEAMARGVPVACSSAASLPEVAGNAAVLFDPLDERAIANAIVRVLTEPETRLTCIQRGRDRALQFSWRLTALAMLKVARQASGGELTANGEQHG